MGSCPDWEESLRQALNTLQGFTPPSTSTFLRTHLDLLCAPFVLPEFSPGHAPKSDYLLKFSSILKYRIQNLTYVEAAVLSGYFIILCGTSQSVLTRADKGYTTTGVRIALTSDDGKMECNMKWIKTD